MEQNIFNKIVNALSVKRFKADPMSQEKIGSSSNSAKVVPMQLQRFASELSKYKLAIEEFEDEHSPTNEALIELYADAILDAHIRACITIRKNKTLSKDYKVVKENGDIDEKATRIVNSKWFKDAMSLYLDTPFFGCTLLQLGNFEGGKFEDVTAYKRQYVYAHKNIIRSTPQDCSGISWEEQDYRPWYVFAGNAYDLGLLASVVPCYIYKKNAFGAWANFQNLFGSPLRIGRTNMTDLKAQRNMAMALEEMGNSAWVLLGQDDNIEVLSSNSSDAHQVFSQKIELMNKEISKVLLGSTMILDEGSSRSQATVHENTSEAMFKSDAVNLEAWINDVLFPHLDKFFGFNFKGLSFRFNDTETLKKLEQLEIDKELLKYYTISTDYIREKYGVDVEEKQEKEQPGGLVVKK